MGDAMGVESQVYADPQVAEAIRKLRESFRRAWSWAVSDNPQLSRIGQEHLLERVDRLLGLVDSAETHDTESPIARLWAVRMSRHVDYPLGTRKLFLAEREDGYWGAFQALFRAAGLPTLSTFDGPFTRRFDGLGLERDTTAAPSKKSASGERPRVPRAREVRTDSAVPVYRAGGM